MLRDLKVYPADLKVTFEFGVGMGNSNGDDSGSEIFCYVIIDADENAKNFH